MELTRPEIRRAAIVGAGFAALLLAVLALPAVFSWGDVWVSEPIRLAIASVLIPVAGAAIGVAAAAAFSRRGRGRPSPDAPDTDPDAAVSRSS